MTLVVMTDAERAAKKKAANKRLAERRKQELLEAIAAKGWPAPVVEYEFSPLRGWRFDYAWPKYRLALESEGAVWAAGRHTRGSGFVDDMEKYNSAALAGWLVLRTTTDGLDPKRDDTDVVPGRRGYAMHWLAKAFAKGGL